MNKEEVKARLEAEPFEPFRITTSGGETIEVRHPNLVLFGSNDVLYIHEASEAPDAQVTGPPVCCGIDQIQNVERIAP